MVTKKRGSALHRIKSVRIVNMPTPSSVSLYSKRPSALRPQATAFHPSPCIRCDSRCCAATVCINVIDFTRLLLIMRVPPLNLIELDPEHQSELTLPAVVEGQSVHMLLRRKPTEGLEHPACHMLARPGGELRCGVHGVRPGICRAYPFEFKTDRSDEIFSVGQPALCPINWVLSPKARRAMEAEILRWRQENDAAERIVKKWNKEGDGSVDGFFDFVVKRAARWLKLDGRPFLNPPPRQLSAGNRLW